MRERGARVKGKRGERRKYFVLEIVVEILLLFILEFLVCQYLYAVFFELRDNLAVPALKLPL